MSLLSPLLALPKLLGAAFPFGRRLFRDTCPLLPLQDGKKPAIPKLDELLAPDSDSEEEPDLELQLPANKVKYMVGQGGDKIKYIQRKTKCRIQVCVNLRGCWVTQAVMCMLIFHLASAWSLPFCYISHDNSSGLYHN